MERAENQTNLEKLNRQQQILEGKRAEVANAKSNLVKEKESNIREIEKEFNNLRDVLSEMQQEVLIDVEMTYEKKSKEFDKTDNRILELICRVKKLDVLNSAELDVAFPALPGRIHLSGMRPAENNIKKIKVRKQNECNQPHQQQQQTSQLASNNNASMPYPIPDSTFQPISAAAAAAAAGAGEGAGGFKFDVHESKPNERETAASPPCAAKRPRMGETAIGSPPSTPNAVGIPDTPTEQKKKLKTRANVRDFVRCSKCQKPRCIYSQTPLSPAQKQELNEWKKSAIYYRCGDQMKPPFSTQGIELENKIDCKAFVDPHYYAIGRCSDHQLVCYSCGSAKVSEPAETERQNYSSYHPVCESCKAAGKEPRTRKKYQSRNKQLD